MRAAIVCPGPSIKRVFEHGSEFLRRKDSYQRHVAVTCALLADFPWLIFCFIEGPNKPQYINRYKHALLEKQPIVWAIKGSIDEWKQAYPGYPCDRLVMDTVSIADLLERIELLYGKKPDAWLAHDPNVGPLKEGTRCGTADRGRFHGAVHRHVRYTCGSSMFYSLARCIVDGFTEIDIYGSDMERKGNWHPIRNKMDFAWKQADKWWDKRWEMERAAYADIEKECAEHGIQVRKVKV